MCTSIHLFSKTLKFKKNVSKIKHLLFSHQKVSLSDKKTKGSLHTARNSGGEVQEKKLLFVNHIPRGLQDVLTANFFPDFFF